jgi:hypothetical protein
MKKSIRLVTSVCALSLIVSSSALAAKAEGPKAKLMSKYDLNKNGVIDGDEIAAVRKDFAADPTGELKRFDANKDGKLSNEEIAEMKPPGSKNADTKKKSGGKKSEEKTETASSTPSADSSKPASP